MRDLLIPSLILVAIVGGSSAEANFEDTRCRCVCPNTMHFASENRTVKDNNRTIYTQTNLNPARCNPVTVVKMEVGSIIDDAHMDAFLANCECRHESRNTVMLKVVVIFVMCLIALLVVYMSFLMCLDPVLRKQRFSSQTSASTASFGYRAQNNEIETNMFAGGAAGASGERDAGGGSSIAGSSSEDALDGVRARGYHNNVLERVEAEQNRWMKKVEEQRKNIFTDHTMLN